MIFGLSLWATPHVHREDVARGSSLANFLGRIVFTGELTATHARKILISWMWLLRVLSLNNGCSDLDVRAANQLSQFGLHTQENSS
jgi:hypothetical protein